jgi:pimeloyl-ACP methyl ester carboxylesterase
MRYSFTEVMGAQTRYLHAGKGPNLLLAHGTGLTADSWYLNIPRLAQHFTVYAPDLLDNGFTEAGPYTGGSPQPLCVEHLMGFADKLGIDTDKKINRHVRPVGEWHALPSCDSGFQNRAHYRLCSHPVFADARSRVYWVTTRQSNRFSGWRAIASPHLPIIGKRGFHNHYAMSGTGW